MTDEQVESIIDAVESRNGEILESLEISDDSAEPPKLALTIQLTPDDPPYRCDVCDRGFWRPQQLAAHATNERCAPIDDEDALPDGVTYGDLQDALDEHDAVCDLADALDADPDELYGLCKRRGIAHRIEDDRNRPPWSDEELRAAYEAADYSVTGTREELDTTASLDTVHRALVDADIHPTERSLDDAPVDLPDHVTVDELTERVEVADTFLEVQQDLRMQRSVLRRICYHLDIGEHLRQNPNAYSAGGQADD